MQNLKNMLLHRGIKPTFQRIKILEYLLQKHEHPTADMIYAALYDKVPTLSKTTIYNTLDVFDKKGLVNTLTITGSEHRYDIVTQNHHHFLCKRCSKIIDIDIECPHLNTIISGEHKIEEVHGYFKGICKDCLDKEMQTK